MDLHHLNKIAIDAALLAGKVIQKFMNDDILVETKAEGTSYATQVVTAVDRACEEVIISQKKPKMMEVDSKKIFFGVSTRWTERSLLSINNQDFLFQLH